MQLAALAYLVGHGDPVSILTLDPFRVEVEAAAVEEADRLAQQRWQRRAEFEAAKTSALTARRILRGLSKMFGGKG